MSLKEELQEDWKQALKSRNKLKADTISIAKAAILLVEKLMIESLTMKRYMN